MIAFLKSIFAKLSSVSQDALTAKLFANYGLDYHNYKNGNYDGDIIIYGTDYCQWGGNVIAAPNLRSESVNAFFKVCKIRSVTGNVHIVGMGLTTIHYFPKYITGDLNVSMNDITDIRHLTEMSIGGLFICSNNKNLYRIPMAFTFPVQKMVYENTNLDRNRHFRNLKDLESF